jgi:hypothetical protein
MSYGDWKKIIWIHLDMTIVILSHNHNIFPYGFHSFPPNNKQIKQLEADYGGSRL